MSVKGYDVDGLHVPGLVLSLRSNHLPIYGDDDTGGVFKNFFNATAFRSNKLIFRSFVHFEFSNR